jgi:hypothetical protein
MRTQAWGDMMSLAAHLQVNAPETKAADVLLPLLKLLEREVS